MKKKIKLWKIISSIYIIIILTFSINTINAYSTKKEAIVDRLDESLDTTSVSSNNSNITRTKNKITMENNNREFIYEIGYIDDNLYVTSQNISHDITIYNWYKIIERFMQQTL